MDTIIVSFLTAFDWLMNLISLGLWSRVQGERKAEYRSKVEVE